MIWTFSPIRSTRWNPSTETMTVHLEHVEDALGSTNGYNPVRPARADDENAES